MAIKTYKLKQIIILLFLYSSCWANIKLSYSITGITGESLNNAATAISSNTTASSESEARQIYLNNVDKIKSALKPYGYFLAKIHSSFEKNDDEWQINYRVTAGKRFKFNHVSVEVIPKDKITIPENIINSGNDFSTVAYNKTKDTLIKQAKQYGYLFANLSKSTLNVDLEKEESSVSLVLILGKKYTFGDVSFEDNSISKQLLEKLVPFKIGDIYEDNKIEELKTNLTNIGLFQQISVMANIPDVEKKDGIVDVKITPQLKPKHEYTVGIGFDTDQYWRVIFEAKNNLITRTGHTARLYTTFSKNASEMIFQYNIPGKNPIKNNYIMAVDLDTESTNTTGTSNYVIASINKKYQDKVKAIEKSINVLYEKSEPNNSDDYYSFMIYPKISLSRNSEKTDLYNIYIDNDKKKYKYFLNWNSLFTLEKLFSTTNTFRSDINSMIKIRLNDKINFLNKISFGLIVSDHFDDVPLSFKFLTGGSNSIRGYSYDSIGPGKILKIFSNELQFNISNSWYLIALADVGNVVDDITNNDLKVGVGGGVLWQTPVGNAKITIAKALNLDKMPWRLQFNFSPNI